MGNYSELLSLSGEFALETRCRVKQTRAASASYGIIYLLTALPRMNARGLPAAIPLINSIY